MREGGAFHPLAEICKALAVNFQSMRVLEIGAGYGNCSVSMRESQVGEYGKGGFVVAIEPQHNLASWVEQNAKSKGVDVIVERVCSPSSLPEIISKHGPFDFVLLDQADKSLFSTEFAMLFPHLSRPCVIVAHDVANGHGGDNFWEEFKQRKDVEFITIPTLPGTGIGVLR